jgi:hypothetical protein
MHPVRRSRRLTLIGVLLSALPLAGSLAAAPAGTATLLPLTLLADTVLGHSVPGNRSPLLFGTSAANRAQILAHEAALGRRLGGVRVYRRWDDPLFGPDLTWARDGGRTLFLSIKSRRRDGSGIRYADLAAAGPGSQLYADLLRQAAQLRAFRATVYLTYQHEPEADPALGTGAEFAAAWRRLVGTYRAAGARNVRFVWTVTGYGFVRADARAARNYWPGDGFVDQVGVDLYNFYRCTNPRGRWQSPAAKLAPVLAFAAGHRDKGVVLMEWSSVEDPRTPGRKAGWIRELSALLRQPRYRQVVAVLQWSGRNYGASRCALDYLTSSTSLAAIRAMATDPLFRGGSLPGLHIGSAERSSPS